MAVSSPVMLLLLLAAMKSPVLGGYPPNGGPAAASALASRVLGPRAASLFSFYTLAPSFCDGEHGPCAVVQSNAGTISIGGTTPVEMAYGLGQYCRQYLHMSFTWERSGGFQTRLPEGPIPQPAKAT